jgi:hypothetical protein
LHRCVEVGGAITCAERTVDALLVGISGGGRQGQPRHDATRKGGSAAITTLRKLPFDLLLSFSHAGERHQPKCSRNLPFRGSCQRLTFYQTLHVGWRVWLRDYHSFTRVLDLAVLFIYHDGPDACQSGPGLLPVENS